MNRWLRGLLGFAGSLLLAPLVLIAIAGPTHACSCVMAPTAEHVKRADAVFAGEVVPATQAEPATRAVRFVVAVDQVFKGEVATEVELHTSSSGASCGIEPLPGAGQPWLWFVSKNDDGVYGAYLCGGSGPVDDKTVAEIVAVTGPAEHAQQETEADPDDTTVDATDNGAGEDDPNSAVHWGVGGLVLVVLAAAFGAGAARRRPPGSPKPAYRRR